jgi:predicted ribonuclease YlaK
MTKLWIADTNALLSDLEKLVNYKIVLLSHTLRELDKHKGSVNRELGFRARNATRFINTHRDKFVFDVKDYNANEIIGDDYDNSYADNKILACAVKNQYGLITNDILLKFKAEAFGLDTIDTSDKYELTDIDYTGYKEVYMTKNEYDQFYYNRLHLNEFNLITNQYLVVIEKGTENDEFPKIIDALKFDGEYYIQIKVKGFNSFRLGKITAKDLYQSCAMDSLITNKFTLLRGKAGTAKTLLSLSYAMQQLEKGKIGKIVVFANSLPTAGAAYLGMNKGDLKAKIMQVSIGHILASKLGDYAEVEAMMTTGSLLVLPMSDIRGFDTTGMNACVIITEGQNTDRELIKLAIQRVGDDGKLIIEGDNKTQLDSSIFEGSRNGMTGASEVFRGQEYYGEVELKNIYRSEIARRAELLTAEY